MLSFPGRKSVGTYLTLDLLSCQTEQKDLKYLAIFVTSLQRGDQRCLGQEYQSQKVDGQVSKTDWKTLTAVKNEAKGAINLETAVICISLLVVNQYKQSCQTQAIAFLIEENQ